MGKKVDLSGKKFSRITVLKDTGKRTETKKVIYECKCDCGKVFTVRGCNLVSGNTKSCGCLLKEYLQKQSERMKTHGKSGTHAYETDLRLAQKYGITYVDVQQLYKQQNNRCAICGKEEAGLSFNIDHCHTTGKVRGLLCRQCNWGLGHFKDNQETLQKAIDYLKTHSPLTTVSK